MVKRRKARKSSCSHLMTNLDKVYGRKTKLLRTGKGAWDPFMEKMWGCKEPYSSQSGHILPK